MPDRYNEKCFEKTSCLRSWLFEIWLCLLLGKVGMFGKVIKQVKGIVHVEADEDELEIPYKNLEPFMPDPGDKAKLLQKSESESVFEVLKYDEDDDEESVIVKNLDNNEESSVRLEHLCRIKV